MKMTVEISMYPLRESYIEPIDAFIAELNRAPAVEVVTTPTSTRIQGEYEDVMALLKGAMAQSYADHGKAVFVTKFLPGYDPA